MTTHDMHRPVDTTPPKVCVVLVLHRPLDHPYVQQALESLKVQTYPNLEAITMDNQEATMTIAQARNQAVQHTSAELVAFMGEEDMLTADLIASMVGLYQLAKSSELEGVVHVTTHMTALLDNGQQRAVAGITAPGLYERAYLLNNPFDPSLDFNVDAAQARNLHHLAQLQGRPVTFAITHHSGYILRMHPFRRDGIRIQA